MSDRPRYLSPRGFSVVELLVASALTIGVAAVVFSAVASSESTFAVQTEAADLQQRLRVAETALRLDLEMAGAGPTIGPQAGSLHRALAAVLPYAIGSAPATPRGDAITLIAVPPTFAQTTLAQPLAAGSNTAVVQMDPGCPLGSEACGLTAGMSVAVFDGTGAFDLFRVRGVSGLSVTLEASGIRSARAHPPGSVIAEIQVHTFLTEMDAGVDRLVRRTGIGGPGVPVADHVVGLEFALFGDPEPPRVVAGASERPETTYGLRPPPGTEQLPSHLPGEYCL
ncbi:MAG: PilW family protein, partial [Vicinamibacterales bacterium]